MDAKRKVLEKFQQENWLDFYRCVDSMNIHKHFQESENEIGKALDALVSSGYIKKKQVAGSLYAYYSTLNSLDEYKAESRRKVIGFLDRFSAKLIAVLALLISLASLAVSIIALIIQNTP